MVESHTEWADNIHTLFTRRFHPPRDDSSYDTTPQTVNYLTPPSHLKSTTIAKSPHPHPTTQRNTQREPPIQPTGHTDRQADRQTGRQADRQPHPGSIRSRPAYHAGRRLASAEPDAATRHARRLTPRPLGPFRALGGSEREGGATLRV